MKFHIPEGITRSFGKQTLVLKKNSPHIFFAVGVVGVVGSTVLACRATLQLEEKLDEVKADIEKVKVAEGLTKSEYDRLILLKYGRGIVKITRLYLPAGAVGVVSLAALTKSHVEMTRRNNALAGALVAMSQAFTEYRERVRAEVGEEKERDIYRNVVDETVEIDGKTKKVKAIGHPGGSPYSRVFDADSHRWEPNPEINRIVLKAQQNYFNHRLNAYGHVFLNEVYEELGLPTSEAGQFVGWLRKEDGGEDGYVDIGIDELPNGVYVDGVEVGIFLDFNVDGRINDKVKWLGR